MSPLYKEFLPGPGTLRKAYLPQLGPRLQKALLPGVLGWEIICKAQKTGHKYIRKYQHGKRWIYVYPHPTKENHHIHTGWDYETHHPHEAPDELLEEGATRKEEYTAKAVHKTGDARPLSGANHVVSHGGPSLHITTKAEFLQREKDKLRQIGEGSGSAEVYVFHDPNDPTTPVIIRFPQDQFDGFEEGELERTMHFGDLGIAPKTYEYRDEGSVDDYHVMEFAGETLGHLDGIAREKTAFAALDRLEELHLAGYAHGDIENPENILAHKTDGAKLIDFQISIKDREAVFDEATRENILLEELGLMEDTNRFNKLGITFYREYHAAQGNPSATEKAIRGWYNGLRKIYNSRKKTKK